MSANVLYTYSCSGCGATGEELLHGDAHGGQLSACVKCGAGVTLVWDGGGCAAKDLASEAIAAAAAGVHPAKPELSRGWSGYIVSGADFSIRLIPNAQGGIAVDVIANPSLTGFKGSCRLGQSEAKMEFGIGGIQVIGGVLECMSSDRSAPIYREGFKIVLEPGMGEMVERIKPALGRVAVVAGAVTRFLGELAFERGIQYLHVTDFVTEVVAAIVLDGKGANEAFECVKREHHAGSNTQFMGLFSDDRIQHLLHTAKTPG